LTRIGARFVNKIDIPLSAIELEDYLLTTATVPPELPQFISGYLLHMQLPMVRPGIACKIISTIIPPPSPEVSSLILDIDVWHEGTLDPRSGEFDGEVHSWLDELRRAKNDVFEACITDNTRRLFL
jgi:uncharacterized protein (TIGR04255 family)